MIEVEIQTLQQELDALISNGVKLSDLYELSLKIDKLIVEYYNYYNPYRYESNNFI